MKFINNAHWLTLIKKEWKTKVWWWEADPVLFWTVIILILLGVIMVFSSSMTTAIYSYGDIFYFLKRHLFGLLLAFLCFIIFSFFPLLLVRSLSRSLLLLSLLLLVLIFVPRLGIEAGGSRRWLDFFLFQFQPSELAKLSVIIYMADALVAYPERSQDLLFGVVPFFLVVGCMGVLILIEPDLSTTVFLFLITFVMLFLGGRKISHILLALVALLPLALFLILGRGNNYWLARIRAFFDPWSDPLGKGFHTIQSLIALGSGGIFGCGLGESRQKFFFLPDRHTDFIYAIVGEELGFIGASVVVLLFGILLWRSWKIAYQSEDEFQSLLVLGIASAILIQAIINMGAVLNLIPVTGVTLPLVSYGSSSLVMTMIELGMIFQVAGHNKRKE